MKKQVEMDSAEWSKVDRQIQLITGRSSIKLIGVFKFPQSSSRNNENILKNGKQQTWIDATVNLTDFSKDYYRQVAEKQVPLQHLILYTGHVNILKYSGQPYKIFTFLLCKVCLGTAASPQTPRRQECDSILIPPQNQQPFQYNFFVKQHWQYEVNYEVNFSISQDKQFKITQFSCCNCQNKTPSIFCSTEKFYFCQDCCNDHHKTKLMQSHSLQAIDKVNTLQNCKTHNQKYELYCLKCEKYLCPMCIQKGVHSDSGTDHVIKSIRYYYDQLVQNIDRLPVKCLEKIDILLYNLKIKKKQIQDNQRQVRNQIEREYKRCIKILEDHTSRKYQVLDSNQLELNLLKSKISWTQAFSVSQSAVLKPVHFFKSQKNFQQEIKKVKILDFDSIINSKSDLAYKGFNIVGTREYVQRNSIGKRQAQQNQQQAKPKVVQANSTKIVENSTSKNQVQDNSEQRYNLLAFDPDAVAPPKGGLLNEIINSKLKFFQLRSK